MKFQLQKKCWEKKFENFDPSVLNSCVERVKDPQLTDLPVSSHILGYSFM